MTGCRKNSFCCHVSVVHIHFLLFLGDMKTQPEYQQILSKQRELDQLDMCRGQIQQLFCFHNFPQQYHSFKLMRGQKIPTQTTLLPRVRHSNEWRLTITHPVTAGRFFIFLAFKTSAERHFVPTFTIPIELSHCFCFLAVALSARVFFRNH